jgi:hypothetical protein
MIATSKIPKTIAMLHDAPAPVPDGIVGVGSFGSGSPGGILNGILTGATPAPVAHAPVARKVAISSGVTSSFPTTAAAIAQRAITLGCCC